MIERAWLVLDTVTSGYGFGYDVPSPSSSFLSSSGADPGVHQLHLPQVVEDQRVRGAPRVPRWRARCRDREGASVTINNDEQAIRAGITKELDAFKNPTQASLSSVIDSDNASIGEIRNMGTDPYGSSLARCFMGLRLRDSRREGE